MDRTEEAIRAIAVALPGSRVEGVAPMMGGMSAHLLRVDLTGADGSARQAVVRFPSPYIFKLFPNAARYEFRTLQAIWQTGLPVQKPLARGENLVILEYLPGAPTAAPNDPESYLTQMAQTLARVHAVDLSSGQFSFLLENKSVYTPTEGELNRALREPEVVAALLRFGEVPLDSMVLRHGDFWPGNLLWQDGQLTGIIDWENALRGPALADLGVSRLDVWWVLGEDAMHFFTEKYLEANPIDAEALVYWDLRAAVRPMRNLAEWAGPYAALDRPDITPSTMRDALLAFIDRAMSRL